MTDQPEALRVARQLETAWSPTARKAAHLLREQHAEIERLTRKAIADGEQILLQGEANLRMTERFLKVCASNYELIERCKP